MGYATLGSAPCTTTYFATWRFCEPQSPFVHERVFDVEVDGVMKDSDLFILVLSLSAVWSGVLVVHGLFGLGSVFRRHVVRRQRRRRRSM